MKDGKNTEEQNDQLRNENPLNVLRSVFRSVGRELFLLATLVCVFLHALTVNAQKVTPDGNGGGGGGGTTVIPVLSVSSSGSPLSYGSYVTFTGFVGPTSCAPNAIATFYDNGSSLGNASWNSNGTATLTTSSLTIGTHSIWVAFGGNIIGTTTCKAATSPAITQVINPVTATISINNLPSNAVYGGGFTATYSYSGSASPAESVTSTTTSVCTASGSTVSFVGIGTCSLYASAAAVGNYAAVTGNIQSLTVNQATPTISINDIPSAAIYGGSFTATYSYTGNGSPSESVTSSTPSVCATSGSMVSFVGAGTCTLVASATATTDFTAATGSAQSFTVGPSTAAISISNMPGNAIYGTGFVATYNYTGNGSPAESVSSSTPSVCTASGSTVSFVGVGTCTLSASATATADFATATGGAQSVTVSQATPSIAVSTSGTPSTYGNSVTFTATVSSGQTGFLVTFYDNGAAIGSSTVIGINSTYTTSTLTVGSHSITAGLAASTDYSAVGSAPIQQVVNRIMPSISVVTAGTPSTYGNPVTFTATVSSGQAGSLVTFYDYGTAIGSGTVNGTTATYATSSLAGGSHSITAGLAASTDYSAVTSSAIQQVVNLITSTISVVTSGTPSSYGASVTFGATIQNSLPGATVTFYDGGTALGTGTTGTTTATYTTSTLAPGFHAITAQLMAGTGYAGATSPPLTQNVVEYDMGTVTLAVGGAQVTSTVYGSGSTPSSVAASLAGNYSNATVKAVDDTIYIEASATGTDPSYSLTVASSYPTIFHSPSFSGSPSFGTLEGGAASGGSPLTVYNYSISYDAASRVIGYSDAVMGTWSNINYDSLNRQLSSQNTGVTNTGTDYAGKYLCWSYDSFGNRTAQDRQTTACPTPESSVTPTATYNANNQVTWTTVNGAAVGFGYDAAGDVTNDNANQYLYDGEGRLCAVKNLTVGMLTGYIYNAEGVRVAKGSLTQFTCDLNPSDSTYNGFHPMSDYILGPAGEQAAELEMNPSGAMAWQHSNAWAGGQLIATYDPNGLHFYANDWQGSRRVQTDYAGVVEQTCASLPFGDELGCTGSTTSPTEHHFTGKERDPESDNDYFEARYYSNKMGRFMSPDWDAKPVTVAYASFGDPQTLNLYTYAENGPLNRVDADGHASQASQSNRNQEISCEVSSEGCTSGGPGIEAELAYNEHLDEAIYLASIGAQEQQAAANTGNNAAAQQQSDTGNAVPKPTTFTYNALVPLSPFVDYTVQSDRVNAVFTPETATRLNAAFGELNKDGIVPQINSAFRTDADQTRMQNGGSGSNPAAKMSWHQAGAALDINGTTSRQFPTIISVMKSHGFVWGGDFNSHKDPPHFDGRNFSGNLFTGYLLGQGYWNATH